MLNRAADFHGGALVLHGATIHCRALDRMTHPKPPAHRPCEHPSGINSALLSHDTAKGPLGNKVYIRGKGFFAQTVTSL